MVRQINKAGLNLIKDFEGFRSDAYLDAVGVPTIGYGHTGTVKKRDVSNGRSITMAQAERLLRKDLAVAEAGVDRFISVLLNENQFAALTSFTFNLGVGNLQASTLRRRLNGGDYGAVPSEMTRWVRAGGKTLAGLVRRRGAEGNLFMTPESAELEAEPIFRGLPIESVDAATDLAAEKGYLKDVVELRHGSVDDNGDTAYVSLIQNVPDGYVQHLQEDIRSLGFGTKISPDGAFGDNTEAAVKKNLPTMVRVDYGKDSDITYNHFVLCVGTTADGGIIMNDPATRLGDGYTNPGRENVVGKTTRKNGYTIVKVDYFDPA